MDAVSSAVLNKIYALGAPGRYFVIAEDEFFDDYPEDLHRDCAELKKALKSLNQDGYIDIKYTDGNMFCVALTKKYVPEPDEISEPENDDIYCENSPKSQYVFTFLAALCGSVVGSLLISLIFHFI